MEDPGPVSRFNSLACSHNVFASQGVLIVSEAAVPPAQERCPVSWECHVSLRFALNHRVLSVVFSGVDLSPWT